MDRASSRVEIELGEGGLVWLLSAGRGRGGPGWRGKGGGGGGGGGSWSTPSRICCRRPARTSEAVTCRVSHCSRTHSSRARRVGSAIDWVPSARVLPQGQSA